MVSKYQITGILQKSGRNDDYLSKLHKYNNDVHSNTEKLRALGMSQLKQCSTASTSGTKKTDAKADAVQRFDGGSKSNAHRLHEEFLNSLRNK